MALGTGGLFTGSADAAMVMRQAGTAATATRACSTYAVYIARKDNTHYGISGTVDGRSCPHPYNWEISCRPIHRHSFNWHTHGIVVSVGKYGRYVSGKSGWIKGTNGDHYKATCRFYYNNYYQGSKTSRTIEL
ncbi:hypothetical protein OG589_05020 [Sphaerisporangium sp. NBC_01403]|uniref:hypothetical protein n=1 Tax=Sphaerisporangium sp. NBC_01403 TaxID=2903599 RepID=UPI0032524A31